MFRHRTRLLPGVHLHFRLLLPLAALLLPFTLYAQGTVDSGPAANPDAIIRGVQLQRRDIFDPNERSWLARMANRLHFQTRPAIIRRELLFQVGEPYDSALVAESERNLRALGIFRRVQIDSVRTPTGLMLRVLAKDGWSTQADWRFRSTGGQVAFTIGLVETNLLGTASTAAVRYRKDPDRSSVALLFRRPRMFLGTVGLGLQYENRSDGRIGAIAIDRPFFALTSPRAFRFEAEDHRERVLRFFEGQKVALDTLSRRFSRVRASAAWAVHASSAGYLRVGLTGQVQRDDFQPEASTAPFSKTVTGSLGPYLVGNQARFIVTRGYAGFGPGRGRGHRAHGAGWAPAGSAGVRVRAGRDWPVGEWPRRCHPAGRLRLCRRRGQWSVLWGGPRLRFGPARRHGRAPARPSPCRRDAHRGWLAQKSGPR